MDSTRYFSGAQTEARHDATTGFAEQMSTADSAIRRDRRPLPSHDLNGANYRKWMAAVLHAELKHATDDFWSCANRLGFGLLFDHYQRDLEASAFRFPHERLAGVAANHLMHLSAHDSDRYGPWAIWQRLSRDSRVAWCRRRRELLHGFLRACHHYQSARQAVDQQTIRRAA